MKHQLTKEDEKIQKHIGYLHTGNAATVTKAIAFFDEDFLPIYNPEIETLRKWHHLWLCAFKVALLRDVPTLDQKVQLLEHYVCNADQQCVLSVVMVYLRRCAPGQHKAVETMLRKTASWVLENPMVMQLFPYALVG